jgi:hypothetical protein
MAEDGLLGFGRRLQGAVDEGIRGRKTLADKVSTFVELAP